MTPIQRLSPLPLFIGFSLLQLAHADTPASDANHFTLATDNYDFSTTGTTVLNASRTANTIRFTGTTNNIDLGASGANTLTLNGIMNAGSGLLTIQSTGGTGTLDIGANNELVVNAANAGITISAPISGASKGLTKTGSGNLTLSGANTYTGATTVNAGILDVTGTISSSSAITLDGGVMQLALGASGITVACVTTKAGATGSTLRAGSGGLNQFINLTNDIALNSKLTLEKSGGFGGGFLLKSITGGMTVGNDALVFSNPGTGRFYIQGDNVGGTYNYTYTGNVHFLACNGGDYFLQGNSIFAPTASVTLDSGSILGVYGRSINYAFDALNGTGNCYVFEGSATLTIGSAGGTGSYGGIISNGFTVFKTGAGTQTFSNLNTYTGGTIVNNGILSLPAVATGAGRIRGALYIETGGEVQFNQWALGNSATAAQNVTIININGGILNKMDAADNGGIHGAIINMTGGEIKGSSCVISNNSGDHTLLNTLASASTATISSGFQMQDHGGQDGGILNFNVADGAVATDLLVSGALTQDGANTQSITKDGDGTMALSGTNSYTGTTSIAAGKLLINGNSSLATGTAAVASGATLGGTGTYGGAIDVKGSLAPGDGIQTLGGGATTFNRDSIFAVELDSAAMQDTEADLFVVNGDLKLEEPVDLRVTDIASFPSPFSPGKVFTLINYTGSWNKGRFSAGGKALSDGDKFTVGQNTWMITYASPSGGDNYPEHHKQGSFVNITAVPASDTGTSDNGTLVAILSGVTALGAIGTGIVLRRRKSA